MEFGSTYFEEELLADLETSAEARRVLIDELQRAQRNQYKRYYLIQSLKMASSKRTKQDLATIHAAISKLAFFKGTELALSDTRSLAKAILGIKIKQLSEVEIPKAKMGFVATGVVLIRKPNSEIE